MDFTLTAYERLLNCLLDCGYRFAAVEDVMEGGADAEKLILLRHDVDRNPENSFKTACIEKKLGIRGTYYFRIVRTSLKEPVVRQIIRLGHEIGYHYEDLTLARGNMELALHLFEQHLQQFRKYYSVKTICMHGSPLSRFDNRMVWRLRHYGEFGIQCEPYFDLDFSKMLYLSDTGRTWVKGRHRVRDMEMQDDSVPLSSAFRFQSTNQIIKTAEQGGLPGRIMINVHPQRWNDSVVPWARELIVQTLKNQAKRVLVSIKPASLEKRPETINKGMSL